MTQLENDSFLRACWRKEAEFTPVWFMRQAGRYLESYRRVRAKNDVLTICKTPELVAKVTVAAVDELGVDAAILFADIMLPLEAMGVKLDLVDGTGPVIENPVAAMEDLEKLKDFSPKDHVPYVLDSVRAVKQALDERVPLIGFSGAPFTLASYLIEGSPSRDFAKTKTMMYSQPELWMALMSRLSRIVSSYLLAQVHAGVDAVQLFDSWSGCLSDWRVPIDEAWRQVGDIAIQGNLDPATLLGHWPLVEARTKEILARIGGRPGHVFNLGHGVLPETSPERAKELVNFVHKATQQRS
ncbi:uroporphyrinogen decarboxylase [Candidatus Bathyarchaeota archaeon]|nr:MAG: uroporphyrinogen decarboxylase [Candidatus Bathyarchaeota archaeon]